jgi:phosphopantetheine adenylyltransferase
LKQVALNNNGLVYAENRELRKQIQEKYQEKNEVQDSFFVSSNVSADQIRSELEDYATGNDSIERLEGTKGYYFDLRDFPKWDKKILDIFMETFEHNAPIVRKKEIASKVREGTNIADEDVEFLLDKFAEGSRDESTHLEKLRAQGTKFYLPGSRLYENTTRPLSDLENVLSTAASKKRDPGTVTRQDIEQALKVEAPDELIHELTRRGYLISLPGKNKWLVNEEGCIDTYTESVVSDEIAPTVEEQLTQHDFIFPAEEYNTIVNNALKEATGILDDLDENTREDVLESIKQSVENELIEDEDGLVEVSIYEETDIDMQSEEGSVDRLYLTWEKKVSDQVNSLVKEIYKQKSGDFRNFVDNEVQDEIRTFGMNDPLINDYYEQLIKQELKEYHRRNT